MKNWDSRINEYTPIKGEQTIEKAIQAISLSSDGEPVSVIANRLGLSKSRIYQYLRK